MAADCELAWAAGFYDGEGSTGVLKQTYKGRIFPYLRMTITQNDPRPLRRFIAAVGAGNVQGPYKGRKLHYVNYTGRPAHRVLELLHPYLGEPKREQAQRALARIEEERTA